MQIIKTELFPIIKMAVTAMKGVAKTRSEYTGGNPRRKRGPSFKDGIDACGVSFYDHKALFIIGQNHFALTLPYRVAKPFWIKLSLLLSILEVARGNINLRPDMKGHKTVITYGDQQITCPLVLKEDITPPAELTYLELPEFDNILKTLIKARSFASNNELKPSLMNVYLRGGKDASIVSTDGHRLYRSYIDYPTNIHLYIPPHIITFLQQTSKKGHDHSIYASDLKPSTLKFVGKDWELIIPDPDCSPYPDFQSVIDEQECSENYIIFPRKQMLTAVTDVVKTLKPEQIEIREVVDSILMKGSNDNNLEWESSIPLWGSSRAPFHTGVRPHYLADVLRAFDDENIEMHQKTPVSAMIIKSGRTLILLMPVRLND